MRRAGGDRIVQIDIDAHWRPAPARSRLNVPTARMLRDEGITMVRIAPGFWRRLTGRAHGARGHDISIARYLAAAEPGPRRRGIAAPGDR